MLLFQGYLPWTWDFASSIAIQSGLISNSCTLLYAEIAVTFIFIILLTIHDTIISLPFSLFKTFVVEQNHGFNKSTVGLFFRDMVRILLLCIVLKILVLVSWNFFRARITSGWAYWYWQFKVCDSTSWQFDRLTYKCVFTIMSCSYVTS